MATWRWAKDDLESRTPWFLLDEVTKDPFGNPVSLLQCYEPPSNPVHARLIAAAPELLKRFKDRAQTKEDWDFIRRIEGT